MQPWQLNMQLYWGSKSSKTRMVVCFSCFLLNKGINNVMVGLIVRSVSKLFQLCYISIGGVLSITRGDTTVLNNTWFLSKTLCSSTWSFLMFTIYKNILHILFTDRQSSLLTPVSQPCAALSDSSTSALFMFFLIVASVNEFIARLRRKIKMSWEIFERLPTCFKCCESETYSKWVGVLKVTPQPQMSLTTILIKGDSYGENRIL